MDSGLDLLTIDDVSMEENRFHLRLLLHAHICLQQETQTTNNSTNYTTTSQNLCTVPYCKEMRIVLQHMTQCENFDNCSVHHCIKSRSIMSHWKNCTTPSCPMCSSTPQVSPKEWQQKLNGNDRDQLIKKIISAISIIFKKDISLLPSNIVDTIRNPAQKIETDAFNMATSHDDYIKRVAAQIFKIKESYEKEQQSSTTVDQAFDAHGSSNSSALQADGNSYSNSTTTAISKHTDNDYVASAGVDRSTHDIYNPTIHTEANESHADTAIMEIDEAASNDNTKSQMTTTDKELCSTNKVSINDHNMAPTTTTSTVEMNENEEKILEVDTSNRPLQNGATNESLPKHPATFSPEDIREEMTPILLRLNDQKEGVWFYEPVTELIAPGYFKIIEHPMDFSTISKKLDANEYTTPFQFWEDMWLVFNNAWRYNKKTCAVYKAALTLADMFMELVDPIMKKYGYCCGRQYVFLAPAMFCYGENCKCFTIPRDDDYFVYNNPDSSKNNLSGDKYTFCKKCFKSVKSKCISVGDDPAQTLVEIPKIEFHRAKNDHQEQEAMVDCIVCSQRFHNICVLYHEHIWAEGYVCKLCAKEYNIKRKDNLYLACTLPKTNLSNALEERVNTFLQTECDADTGRVTIRVLAASDRICEVKPRFKKHFGAQVPDGYPYRTKAIFAFQEIDGVDVVLFGMHVQEYDSRCPPPNANRVYISYLDSVHYFKPTDKRTELYQEILIGYLEYVKQLGFVYAHIWACPPKHGDDYIFHCHPADQLMPNSERLQEWYKNMLDKAILQRVALHYKDIIEDFSDSRIDESTGIPYFEGDCWPSKIEELIEKLEATHKKTNQGQNNKKNKTNEDGLFSKITTLMKKDRASFFVVRLRDPGTLTDQDPLIQCDLMESRDAFLNFAYNNHCEFSSLRRAKHSTMISLIELHSSTVDKISYTCNPPPKDNAATKHEHRMDRSDEINETTTNSDTPVNTEQKRQENMREILNAIRHAIQCQDATCESRDCSKCKRLIQHTKECTEPVRKQCPVCGPFLSPIGFHAKTCANRNCPLPYCTNIQNMILRQRAPTMRQPEMKPGSSSLNSEISEPITTTTRFKRSIESVIPNSTDKLMPSDSKKRKSLSINRLAYNPLPQQLPFQQEQIIIPAINDNSSESEPTLPPLSSSVTALPIERN